MISPIQPYPTDNEFVLMARVELLERTLSEIREHLQIPERPAEIDPLYHASLAGTLSGRMQMALNLIDSPVVALETEK